MTVPQFTVKHRGPAVFSGGGEVVNWARSGQVGCPCLGCGWFSQSSPTEVAMQAALSSLAFALVRDSKPTSWLQLSWLWDVSICLVMDAMGVGAGWIVTATGTKDLGRGWGEVHSEKNQVKKK